MAGVVNTAKLSARLAGRYAPRCASRRGFRFSAQDRAAQNFTMPALSPTMTEGNIASWRMKEGDSFTAGDVILEIETDKATMDVEAQDDGLLFKITQPDGSKGVKVGDRIAVMAEEGDDLSSLEMPADENNAGAKQPAKEEKPAQQEETSSKPDFSEASSAQTKPTKSGETTPFLHTGQTKKQTYPLFPAVQQLLHENGLGKDDADSIPASGPAGRLLKGDVLAYLGRIQKDYPAQISARINKLSQLDLSNIQLVKPSPPKADASKDAAAKKEAPQVERAPETTKIALPISLAAVMATQKRVHDTLGIFLPLSTFLARASELANEDLPPSRNKKPTADDLFNAVLGLDKVQGAKSSRGSFIPEITGLSPMPPLRKPTTKKPDIIDLLTRKSKSVKAKALPTAATGISAGQNIFAVAARSGEKARATVYLERMKVALEEEPGRLVL